MMAKKTTSREAFDYCKEVQTVEMDDMHYVIALALVELAEQQRTLIQLAYRAIGALEKM